MKTIIAYFLSKRYYVLLLPCAGVCIATGNNIFLIKSSELIITVFSNFLKFLSIPLVFLSLVTTLGRMDACFSTKKILKKLGFYTLSTTLISSIIALMVFLMIRPAQNIKFSKGVEIAGEKFSYFEHLKNVMPTNVIQPFYENNILSVFVLAILIGLGVLTLPQKERKILNNLFSSSLKLVMNMTQKMIQFIPLVMGAFVYLFINELDHNFHIKDIGLYLLSLMIANLTQACIVLSLFLLSKRISPWQIFRKMFPALMMAFFSKSSSAAMPAAINHAIEKLKISREVALFSFPLCTAINMNACAAFILTTVLFVCEVQGYYFSAFDLVTWIFIATFAAIGNAGVPMGCYFLTCSLLSTLNVSLNVMGVILPFYAFFDMFESAINLWSDSCITAIVDRDLKKTKNLRSFQGLGNKRILRNIAKNYNPIKT